ELETRFERRARDGEPDAAVRVLQVRRDRAGAEVCPAADHGMAHEALVGLVGIPQEHAVRHLAPHVAARADRRHPHRAAQDAGVGPDPHGSLQPRSRADLGPALEYDGTGPHVEYDPRLDYRL